MTRSRSPRATLALPVLIALGCSAEPAPTPEGTAEPAWEIVPHPPLPPSCDEPLPGVNVARARPSSWHPDRIPGGIRAEGSRVYYLDVDGVVAVDMPDGIPGLVAAAPPRTTLYPDPMAGAPGPDGGATAGLHPLQFEDFWLDGDSIVAVASGVLFRAPKSGGELVRIPGTEPWDGPRTAYARLSESLYFARFGEAGWTISRMPWSGGAPTVLAPIAFDGTLLAGTTGLFFGRPFDRAMSLPAEGADGGAPVDLGQGVLFGADEYAYIMRGGRDHGFAVPWHVFPSVLHRVDSRGEPSGVAGALPIHFEAEFGPATNHPRLVLHDGAYYFLATGDYQLPDDRVQQRRPVLMRYSPDSETIDPVRCMPLPPFDAALRDGGLAFEPPHIAATEAGVFVLVQRDTAGLPDGALVYPRMVRAWP